MTQRISERLQSYGEAERGVSPVIGVILMVAITVILAAVIAAFVLGIGGQNEVAPQPAIQVDQGDRSIQELEGSSGPSDCTTPASDNETLTSVEFSLTGGDDLDQREIHIGYNPAASESGSRGIGMTGESCGNNEISQSTNGIWNKNRDRVLKPPDSANVLAHLRPDTTIGEQDTNKLLDGAQVCQVWMNSSRDLTLNDNPSALTRVNNCNSGTNQSAESSAMDIIKENDDVSVVWEAQGSDKSSVLRKYTVKPN